MGIEDGDIIELKIFGMLQGQVVLNVWHYQVNTATSGFVNIAPMIPLWFVDFDVLVLTWLSQDLTVSTIVGKNLTNPIQIFEGNVTATGDLLGDAMPVHDTLSVKLLRSTGITRNGRKAFSGLTEDQNTDGNAAVGSTVLADVEEFCGEPKTYANPSAPEVEVTFTPVIVGRTLNLDGVYELDLAKINIVAGAQANARVRTQNTRKG